MKYHLSIVTVVLVVVRSSRDGQKFCANAFGLSLPNTSATFRGKIGSKGPFHGPQRPYLELRASQAQQEDLLEEIRSMRVKELKGELSSLSISTADVFEKEELVQRLYKARKSGVSSAPAPTPPPAPRQEVVANNDDSNVLRGPLLFVTVDSGKTVEAVNDFNVVIDASVKPFPAIEVELKQEGCKLKLLLDTACTSAILRPSVVKQHNIQTSLTPVRVSAAGGTSIVETEIATLNRFAYGINTYGPLPAVVQDIGGLPECLDGMVGLSLLSQFACVDFDFRDRSLALYKSKPSLPAGLATVAEADMQLSKVAVFTADVMLDGRGPVKMLVDTGCATSFLNWKGVSDMSLKRHSAEISSIEGKGALGADAVAIELSHRYTAKQVNLGRRSPHPGYDLRGGGIDIDIGDIPLLQESLLEEGVGGILGIDLLMQVGVVRMTLNGPFPRITLLD